MNSHEDFFLLVIRTYIVTSALKYLGMSSFNSEPSASVLSPDVWMSSAPDRCTTILDIAAKIVDKYVDLAVEFKEEDDPSSCDDSIYSYACEVMNLGLLYMEFCDGIKEGDGDRVIRVWKYLMLLFRESKRKNYAIEAFTLLQQYYITLPPQLAEQLKVVKVHQ